MTDVLVIGSSHINKLKEYIDANPDKRNFDIRDINVHCYGISGGRIRRTHHVRDLERMIRIHNPSAIVIHIGGNDLDCENISLDEVNTIILRYTNLLKTFVNRYGLHIVVCELMNRERTRNVDVDQYNEYVFQANQMLKAECHNEKSLTYWKLKGLKQSTRKIFYDGVHLNRLVGQPKYYRNIRGAILHAFELCKNYRLVHCNSKFDILCK